MMICVQGRGEIISPGHEAGELQHDRGGCGGSGAALEQTGKQVREP